MARLTGGVVPVRDYSTTRRSVRRDPLSISTKLPPLTVTSPELLYHVIIAVTTETLPGYRPPATDSIRMPDAVVLFPSYPDRLMQISPLQNEHTQAKAKDAANQTQNRSRDRSHSSEDVKPRTRGSRRRDGRGR